MHPRVRAIRVFTIAAGIALTAALALGVTAAPAQHTAPALSHSMTYNAPPAAHLAMFLDAPAAPDMYYRARLAMLYAGKTGAHLAMYYGAPQMYYKIPLTSSGGPGMYYKIRLAMFHDGPRRAALTLAA